MRLDSLAGYLGKPTSEMLSDEPFRSWPFEKSIEEDLDEPIIHYVFSKHGLELRADNADRVAAIFLHSDELNGFDDSQLEAPFQSHRWQIIELLGMPSKSGGKVNDPILGQYGPWDRFAQKGYSVHIEYQLDSDHLKKITLIRDDIAP